MPTSPPDALVFGHICLDLIPGFPPSAKSFGELFVPGKLVNVENAVFCTGGAASNTGLALNRLGFKVGIGAKIGDDFFGKTVLELLSREGPHLAESVIVSPDDATSYSLILNPPHCDRMIFHCPGANDTLLADDFPRQLPPARVMHFGYPPLIRNFYLNGGAELEKLFQRAREAGLATSLDMSRPDPDSPSGRVDWAGYLRRVLPWVDIFLPSIDELLYMLRRDLFDEALIQAGGGNIASCLSLALLSELADSLLVHGPAVVGFKLGDQGFYLKVTRDRERLRELGGLVLADLGDWRGAEILAPCRKVKVAGTIGAGDCTIAGFLGALLKGLGPDAAAAFAVATGGACVEELDAYRGVPKWGELERRLAGGWERGDCVLSPDDWGETSFGNRRR